MHWQAGHIPGQLAQVKELAGKGDVLSNEPFYCVMIAVFGGQADNALVLTGLQFLDQARPHGAPVRVVRADRAAAATP